MTRIKLRHEHGVLKPIKPASLPLAEGQEVEVDLPSGLMTELTILTPAQERAMLRRQKAGLRKICGMVKDGPIDGSRRHDEILYGLTRTDEPDPR